MLLGPDLRVLILLEYPGVSPRGSPDKAMVKEVGRAEGLPRSGYNTRKIFRCGRHMLQPAERYCAAVPLAASDSSKRSEGAAS